MNTAHKISEYDQQAIDFLESTGTTLHIVYLYTGKYFPDDKQERDIYQFTLNNSRGSYSAKFGDSINNTLFNQYVKQKKSLDYKQDYDFCKSNKIKVSTSGYICRGQKPKVPSVYEILACLNVLYVDSFEDFCSEFGYDDMPLNKHDQIMKIFLDYREQSNALKRLFNSDDLEQLAEIA